MSQQPHSPLQSQAFSLEFPQSLGTYREYADVQRMVDVLADAGFPVQNTLIVGTDLRLIERVTGRKTWSRVILGGALSGMWMGLFVGLLFSMLSSNWLSTILSSVLLGAVFFTVWAVIGHAMSGGQRDFTSMTATVPMHYELLVEHRNVMDARRILTGAGIRLGDGAFGGSGYGDSAKNRPTGPGTQSPGTQSPGTQPLGSPSYGADGPSSARSNRPQYGQSAPESRDPMEPAQGSMASGATRDGAHSFGDSTSLKSDDAEAPKRPTFGLPSDPDSARGTHGDDEPHPRG
ncbi:general stress protein [Dermabacter sp.]|uniref:general stress protein n=1 Tax=Dermabacter sp. TaxID=37640 RepID=UPI002900097C|nr:general stress protein [Dermabacter sp.]MDU1465154.1 general stress protein [Dermabacter sp.]